MHLWHVSSESAQLPLLMVKLNKASWRTMAEPLRRTSDAEAALAGPEAEFLWGYLPGYSSRAWAG
jgi:hypothetical protein